jgi:hypothetical protein
MQSIKCLGRQYLRQEAFIARPTGATQVVRAGSLPGENPAPGPNAI